MSNKDEAMENFQKALNNSNNKDNEEENKQQQENTEENSKKRTQGNKPTNKNQEEQEERKQTIEEKLREEQEDRTRYNIYDDDAEEDEEEDNNDNNSNNVRRNKSSNDSSFDDSQLSDNFDNSGPSSSKIDDSKNSATSASATKTSGKKGANKGSQTNDTETNSGGERYRPNNKASETAQQNAEKAGEAAEKAETASKAAAATEKGAEAGATAAKTGKIAGFLANLFKGIALWKVILIVVAIIFAIIIIIGYISFFTSGVGLVREKLLKDADILWNKIEGFFVGKEDAQVDKEHIINIADDLEEMGYDLVNFGFLNTNGKQVTVEEEKDADGKVVREITKNNMGLTILEKELDGNSGELKITDMKSKYIAAYLSAENRTYIVANQNKNVASVFGNLKDWFIQNGEYSEDSWGTGMIYIEGMSEATANNLGVNGDSDWGKSKNIKIDRENKRMIITKDKHVYQYDLDGWTGRYGMPIEFLLTLHVATMAPDFVYDVATEDDFDSKVHIALYEIGTGVEFVYKTDEGYVEITGDNYSQFGITEEEWIAMNDYNNDNITTYTPIITKVVNHWFKNLDFAGCYTAIENDPNTTEDDDKFVYYYKYIGLGEENDVLTNMSDRIENVYIREERKKDVFQTQEPKVVDNSKKIKQMLLGSTDEENSENTNEKYKYDIYTGTEMPKEQKSRVHDYIIKKIKNQSEEETDSYDMNTSTFNYAFAILESVHSEDAEFILRDLKELFRSVGIQDETLDPDQGNSNVQPLNWPIEGYKPIVWDATYDADNSKVNIRHKTEDVLGFNKEINFIMPADGEIIQITKGETAEDNTYTGDSVKIKFTGTDGRDDVKDMYIYISGIKLDDNIAIGQTYSSKERIGETIDRDIIIVMTDSKRKAVPNVEDYIQPEDWSFEQSDSITDSNFGNDPFGGGNTPGGNIVPYEGTFSEKFYWYMGVFMEGMPITTDKFFTRYNGGVNWLSGESYITVGPGLYMHEGNCQRFRENGYFEFDQYSLDSVFPKDVTQRVYIQSINDEYSQAIADYMQGYDLTQNQMEALVMSAYQRGTGSSSSLWRVLDAIKQGKTGEELMNIWTVYTGNAAYAKGVKARRYAEWYLFTYGVYINKDTGREIKFTTDTPFTDALNGINSVNPY